MTLEGHDFNDSDNTVYNYQAGGAAGNIQIKKMWKTYKVEVEMILL